jgi:hypothetical protein
VCVCSLSNPAFNAHASYCHLWPVPYLFTLSHKSQDFRENVIEHKMCVLIFSTNLSETFLILRRIQLDIIIEVHGSLCNLPVILEENKAHPGL